MLAFRQNRATSFLTALMLAAGTVVTADFRQITLDMEHEWTAYQRPGAPELYPEKLRDEIRAIRALWPRFETLVGLSGRKMYALIDESAGTYAACTPVRAGDARVRSPAAARAACRARRNLHTWESGIRSAARTTRSRGQTPPGASR